MIATILLAAQFAFAPPVGNASGTAIAAGNGRVMLVWTDESSVHWQRFDFAGAPVGAPMTISSAVNAPPAVATSGEMFLIAWSDPDGVHAIREGVDGPIDPKPVSVTADGALPSVAGDGKSFLVVFSRRDLNGIPVSKLYDVVIDRNGIVSPEALLWQQSTDPTYSTTETTWTGTTYLVGYAGNTWGSSFAGALFVAPDGLPATIGTFIVGSERLFFAPGLFGVASGAMIHIVVTEETIGVNGSVFSGIPPTGIANVIGGEGSLVDRIRLPKLPQSIVFDGREFVLTSAPAAALEWPFVVIADRGFIHIVSAVRSRTAAR